MSRTTLNQFFHFNNPPTEDELQYSDGIPMESERHVKQLDLLMNPLKLYWQDKNVYVGGDMFVYFSPNQLKTDDFRGPDFFVALDVPKRERKSWVVWEEGKGPDIVIEMISKSTAKIDKKDKKLIYEQKLRVPEYVWFDPFTAEWQGYLLENGRYRPLIPDKRNRLKSEQLQLLLIKWQGTYQNIDCTWLRWATIDNYILPTSEEELNRVNIRVKQETERAEQEAKRAEQEAKRAEQEAKRAEQEAKRAEQEAKKAEQEAQLRKQAEQRIAELEKLLKHKDQ